jgi:cardiolipin synthase
VVLLQQLDAAQWVVNLRLVALDATMALTVISGLHYTWITARRLGGAAPNGTGR